MQAPINEANLQTAGGSIVILEPSAGESEHSQEVTQALAHQGYNPQNVSYVDAFQHTDPSKLLTPPPGQSGQAEVDNVLDFSLPQLLQSSAKTLEAVDPSQTSVVSASYGITEMQMLNNMMTLFRSSDEFFTPEAKELIATQGVFDPVKTEAYIDEYLERKAPEIQEAQGQYQAQVQRLTDAGVPVVVAAGNNGKELKSVPEMFPEIQFEADEGTNFLSVDEAISVAATTPDGQVAEYSSMNESVDFATVPNSQTEGTSFSAPVVAGLIDDLKNQGLNSQQAIGLIQQNAERRQAESGIAYNFVSRETVSGLQA